MATATVEEVQLLKTLRWYDGFVIALCNPGFLLGSLGFTLGIFGATGSMILWGASAAIGMLQAWIYSEPATMFGHRSGGISLYAHEGWRGYTTMVGPLSAFGYWIGWSVVLSIFGKIIGDLAQAQWWPKATWHVAFLSNNLGLPHFIAIGCILFVWAFNVFGLRPAVWFTYLCGALLMIPLALFIIAPYFTGDWHSSNVHATFPGPWSGIKLALVYMFILAWSTYGTEACATFAPEYHDTRRDTARALRSASMFMLLMCLLVPLGLGGVTGAVPAATAEGQFYTQAMTQIVGHSAASVFTICIIAALLLSMTSSTADAGRALYGISRAGMTIKELGVLSRYHVPARAMTVDLAVNVLLVLLIKSNLAILYMSNIGYVMCHVFALSGFLLLRRDRPDWPRPIQVASGWLPVAAVLCGLNAVFLFVGALAPKLNGYGSWADFGIGVGVLVASLLLFFFRRVVQDGESVHWSEPTPAMPDAAELAMLGFGGGAPAVAGRSPVVAG
ncbi:MAG: APC family permease [Solirubrobacterales bacterium]|nr:APC family permease [Solirubrobacterales bacterium]MBV9716315.1 APC family permease [Solirubrobacterales bacterium]